MGNPIQSIRITYDFEKRFRDNNVEFGIDKIVDMLNSLGVPEELIQKYPRFKNGYSAEDLFMRIYSLLPWVRNVVPLGQDQYPESSKEESQVPDYLITYETGDCDTTSSIFVEVKLVDRNKQTFKIPKYQFDVLKAYAESNKIPLLFGLFWREKGIWTVNSIEVFDEKSSGYKITYIKAIKNDLSSIFGDYVYFFSESLYRTSHFNNGSSVDSDYFCTHEKYGKLVREEISLDNIKYTELDEIHSPVIDCLFDMIEINREVITKFESKITECYNPNNKNAVTTKLSSLMYAYLVKLWFISKEDLYYKDNLFITHVFDIVDGTRQMILGNRYYLLPSNTIEIHDNLINSQFGKVNHIIDPYLSIDRKENCIICAPHDEGSPTIWVNI